jgi:hypothetical protein
LSMGSNLRCVEGIDLPLTLGGRLNVIGFTIV